MRVLSVICVLSLSPLISVAQAKQVLPGPFPFELVEVIDGDTFRARVDIWLGQSVTVRVRLKGVDTPEIEGKCAAEKKLARQAKAFAENWFKKNQAELVNVHYGTYAGRVLATAQIKNGESLSAALLAENLAKPYRGRRAQWCD
ncbi:MAG TPA: nuclease [Rhodobiaceae bacterium]|nr:nuclease [Rhodobiaceae bacterium]|tara:strand:+ start:453 stop:884 length:432 start_codon:yes stop_codon:yes gene_type:complete